jgi:uncharacterized protein GlcG (DUF336 family)
MKVTVTVLDGQGMPKNITVEVSDDATEKEVQEALEKAAREASCATG